MHLVKLVRLKYCGIRARGRAFHLHMFPKDVLFASGSPKKICFVPSVIRKIASYVR